MTILSELLNEIKTDDNLEKIRIMCDQIFEEELSNQHYPEKRPVGPNLFLVLEVPGSLQNEVGFLGLERESEDVYLAVLFTSSKINIDSEFPQVIKKKKVWEINDDRPEKILTTYAKHYKILIGE